MVRKGNGTIRFCVAYRQLNKETLKDLYPLPLINVYLDALAGSRSFHLRLRFWLPPGRNENPRLGQNHDCDTAGHI